MTEVLTGANEAERGGKNGPVGRGLAGEPGDVSSAPGTAAHDLPRLLQPSLPAAGWACSALPGAFPSLTRGNDSCGFALELCFLPPRFPV